MTDTFGRITFGPLLPNTLGFENILEEFEKSFIYKDKTTFPPHNIIKSNDNTYVVELAIAGYGKDDIEIFIEDSNLIIKGTKKVDASIYLHKGISSREFTKSIKLADTVEVRATELKDGILRIVLENVIPEQKKPRKIEIGKSFGKDTKVFLRE